ncbi:MAG: hypothetical protein IPG89_06490 [Bacteroidetes bacterium]|nr:hypothetical protein [Bacteroidota bacterium]
MKSIISSLIILLFCASSIFAQDATKQFSTTKSKKEMLTLISKSMPTLEDCKAIYKTNEDAEFYFKFSEDMKTKLSEEIAKTEDEKFVDISFETFTTEDIAAGKGNYAGGMTKLNGKLKPAITFYKVELLREKGAEYGMSYKYWVYINSKWVFLPKPYSAFKNAQ